MKKIESLFVCGALIATIVAIGAVVYNRRFGGTGVDGVALPVTKYGAFLAGQHAIYVNDFDSAVTFANRLGDIDIAMVHSMRYMSDFLSGNLPGDAGLLKAEKSIPAQLIYDAYLLNGDDWQAVYKRHKKESSVLSAPLRIWSAVATGNKKEALKFIDTLPTATSWKNFVRGQIYAETGDIDSAVSAFADVRADFMNISDYLYMMSFYLHNDLPEEAEALKNDFTALPGGMFMLNYDAVPDWQMYSGFKNALAFSLVQNVSHTQIMMYSDLALLLLRFAQITGAGLRDNGDAINYYLGQYFYNTRGDWAGCFEKIRPDSPYYAFAGIRFADKNNDINKLKQIVYENPLFVPGVQKLLFYNIQSGNQRGALRVVNRTLDNKNLNDRTRAFFLKSRAQIYYSFGNFTKAQQDLHDASKIFVADQDILALQAKIWAAQNRNIEDAYEYAMNLVRRNPSDVVAWDTLGRVIAVREGDIEALDLVSRVGDVAVMCSSLFDLLGDLYSRTGQTDLARKSYMRAISLSSDGLVVVPVVQKKLRNLK